MDYSSEDSIDEWQHIQFPNENSITFHQIQRSDRVVDINENHLSRADQHEPSQIVPAHDGEEISDVSPMPAPSLRRRRVADEGGKLWRIRLEAIRDGVVRVSCKVRDYAICAGAFWSITYVTGVAAAAAAFLVYVGIQRRRRRRKLHRESRDHLACLLREKDEKIGQLLFQIAHLNEVLSSRRKVPVLRL